MFLKSPLRKKGREREKETTFPKVRQKRIFLFPTGHEQCYLL